MEEKQDLADTAKPNAAAEAFLFNSTPGRFARTRLNHLLIIDRRLGVPNKRLWLPIC